MNKYLLAAIFTISFLTATPALAADIASDDTLDTGLVSFWKCNEASGTRYDIHGDNNLSDNNSVTQEATGILKEACDFEKTNNEHLSIADASQTDLDGGDDLSFSAFVKFESLPTSGQQMNIFSKWGSGTSNQSYLMDIFNNSGTYEYRFIIRSGSTSYVLSDTPTISTETWYHVAVSVDGSATDGKLYWDNVEVDSSTSYAPSYNNNATDFVIGSQLGSFWFMDGEIDEIGFWNKPLTAAEITELYNSGSSLAYIEDIEGSSLETNLVSFWNLDETTGTRVDSTASGNDLTETNSVTSGTGVISNAADFELDNSEYLSEGSADAAFDVSTLAMSCWINPEQLPGTDYSIMSKHGGGGNRKFFWYLDDATDDPSFLWRNSGNTSGSIAGANTKPTAGTFQQVGINFDVSGGKFIFNGLSDGTFSGATGLPSGGSATLQIGAQNAGNFFDGLVDECGFWDAELTDPQWRQVWNDGDGLTFSAGGGGGEPEVNRRIINVY